MPSEDPRNPVSTPSALGPSPGGRFRGRYTHTLDKKGRVSLPSRYREALQSRNEDVLVLSAGDGGLVAYPQAEWSKLEDDALNRPQHNEKVLNYMRTILASGIECPVDAQGRILIPPDMRSLAELKDKVLFVSMINRFEIWNVDRFNQRFAPTPERIGEAESHMDRMDEKNGS